MGSQIIRDHRSVHFREMGIFNNSLGTDKYLKCTTHIKGLEARLAYGINRLCFSPGGKAIHSHSLTALLESEDSNDKFL